jgi:hypothetical protein
MNKKTFSQKHYDKSIAPSSKLNADDTHTWPCPSLPYSPLSARPEDCDIAVTISSPMVYIMMVGKTSQRPLRWRVSPLRDTAQKGGVAQAYFGMIHRKMSLDTLLWPMLSKPE